MEESSKNSALIIGNCLSCNGLVRVPVNGSRNSTVRCPHCAGSFPLANILDRAVPELEIIEDAKPTESRAFYIDQIAEKNAKREARGPFVVPAQLSNGAKRRSSRKKRSVPRSSSNGARSEKIESKFKASNGYAANSGSSVSKSGKSPRVKASSSSRTQKLPVKHGKNPVVETFKLVFGGLLAFPIAYLLIFWVFQKDPLHVGPKIGSIAPYLVPEEFRAPVTEIDQDTGSASVGMDSDAVFDGLSEDDEPFMVDVDPDLIPHDELNIPIDPDLSDDDS